MSAVRMVTASEIRDRLAGEFGDGTAPLTLPAGVLVKPPINRDIHERWTAQGAALQRNANGVAMVTSAIDYLLWESLAHGPAHVAGANKLIAIERQLIAERHGIRRKQVADRRSMEEVRRG